MMTTPDSEPPPVPGSTTVNTAGGPAITNSQFDKSPVVIGSQIGELNVADTITNITQTEELAYQVNGECPYPGLNVYTYEDREKFSGREAEVRGALEAMTQAGAWRPLYFITGASGSGKSSFAQAGLVPALEAFYKQQGFTEVRHSVFRPSSAPLAGLAAALQQLNLPAADPFAPAAALMLRPPTTPLPPPHVSLLVLDQFEELFTQSNDEQAAALLAILESLPALPFKNWYLHVIATMRADYLPELFRRKELYNVAKLGADLRAMTAAELHTAIARPLVLRYPNGEKRFEPALLDRLAADAAADARYLPLLQITLEDLWRGGSLRLSAYASLTKAIEARAESVYALDRQGQPRPPDDQRAMMRLFLDLVQVADDDPRRDVRCRRTRGDLEQGLGDGGGLIDELVAQRLLATATEQRESGPEVDVVDIIHEALIRGWSRLQQAIAEQRRVLRHQGRFVQRLKIWLENQKSDDYALAGVDLEEALVLQRAGNIELRGHDARELLASSLARRDQEQRERFMPAIVQSLAAQALRQQDAFFNDERAALLARQAYLFRQSIKDQSSLQDPCDDALRKVLGKPFFSLLWDSAPYSAVAFSTDGRWLAASADTVQLRDLSQRGVEPRTLYSKPEYSDQVSALAFSPDCTTLAFGGHDNDIWLWDLRQIDSEPRRLIGHDDVVQAVAFSPDGRILASSADDKMIRLWDLQKPDAAPVVLSGHEEPIEALAFSPNNKILASGGYDKTIRLWDLEKPDAPPVILGKLNGSIEALVFAPDSQHLISGSYDGTIRQWDLQGPDALPPALADHDAPIQTLALSPDGATLATGSNDNAVRLWNMRDLAAGPIVLQGHRNSVVALAFSPDGAILASGSFDNTVRLWDMRPPQSDSFVLTSFYNETRSAAFSPDGASLATGAFFVDVELWDLQTRGPTCLLREQVGIVHVVTFSPDGQTLAIGDNRALRLCDLRQPFPTATILFNPQHAIQAAAFSSDGQLLAAGGVGSQVRVWNLGQEGAEPLVLSGHTAPIRGLVFSPDQRTLASSAEDLTIRIWDLQRPGAATLVLSGHLRAPALELTFSPDGQILVSGGQDGAIGLWDMRQPTATPRLLPGHEGAIGALAFASDGQTFASGSDDATVRIWNLRQLDAPTILSGYNGPIRALAFIADGRTLASCDQSRLVRRWLARTSDVADEVCTKVRRNLTFEEWGRFVGQDIPYERTCPDHPIHPSVLSAAYDMAPQNLDGAIALFRRAAAIDSSLGMNPEADAHEAAARGLVGSGDLADILAHLQAARDADPQRDLVPQRDTLIDAAQWLRQNNQAEEALKALDAADSLAPAAPVPAVEWNRICWQGSVLGQAAKVLRAGERAVALEPENGEWHDTRALARALTGDFPGAIEDFKVFIAWTVGDAGWAERAELRKQFVAALQEGRNPFDQPMLERLRQEP